MTIDELIAKLEAASGPDRELDYAIFDLAKAWPKVEENSSWRVTPNGGSTCHIDQYAERYTKSIDAAFTLVPEGWQLCLANRDYREQPAWWCDLYDRNLSVDPVHLHFKPTAALAICIAALKARKEHKD